MDQMDVTVDSLSFNIMQDISSFAWLKKTQQQKRYRKMVDIIQSETEKTNKQKDQTGSPNSL